MAESLRGELVAILLQRGVANPWMATATYARQVLMQSRAPVCPEALMRDGVRFCEWLSEWDGPSAADRRDDARRMFALTLAYVARRHADAMVRDLTGAAAMAAWCETGEELQGPWCDDKWRWADKVLSEIDDVPLAMIEAMFLDPMPNPERERMRVLVGEALALLSESREHFKSRLVAKAREILSRLVEDDAENTMRRVRRNVR